MNPFYIVIIHIVSYTKKYLHYINESINNDFLVCIVNIKKLCYNLLKNRKGASEYMEKRKQDCISNSCMIFFMLCMILRFIEYFLIETDKTVIGENVIHKIVGIIILALILKKRDISWGDIGFKKNDFISSTLKGLLLGVVCFSISFGLELAILALQGNSAHFEIYISSFSLTGSQIKNTNLVYFLLCILFNIVNVWMEEGIFRGFFIRKLSERNSFMKANIIAAFLFGIWHIIMPIRSYMSKEMSFETMLFIGIGYIVLSGVMGLKWGILYQMTENIWIGFADHLFNNTIATNMLHVVSLTGVDELQIIRILFAQLISFTIVFVIYLSKKSRRRINGI